jgi:hypothetical protein
MEHFSSIIIHLKRVFPIEATILPTQRENSIKFSYFWGCGFLINPVFYTFGINAYGRGFNYDIPSPPIAVFLLSSARPYSGLLRLICLLKTTFSPSNSYPYQ